jgi:NADP-dependent aldehyde dehydrogenase
MPTSHAATPHEVDAAAHAADAAFRAGLPNAARAALLRAVAEGILALGDDLLATAALETSLPASPRLAAERDRTVFQLRMFADLPERPETFEPVIDRADPARTPTPKPDLRRILRPLGPIAVFGASNFPLAYSAPGGDTASAIAAGCPVVVKGHPAHPATGAMIARIFSESIIHLGLHPGTFAYLPSCGDRDLAVGTELVTHPAIKAVGFTGSPAGGMALVRLAANRPDPIPVFAEMGSVNPVVILPSALANDPARLASTLAASATASFGQMCTCPGLFFAVVGPGFDAFAAALANAFAAVKPATMLSPRVQSGYTHRLAENTRQPGVTLLAGNASAVTPTPTLLRVSAADFIASPILRDECFGPAAILVACDTTDRLLAAAATLQGSLTGTLWTDPTTSDPTPALARAAADLLLARVGRLIVNSVPTGVEVSPAMVHSGPMPACNRPDTTAVGPHALRRWCRPVCFQNCPPHLLPDDLRDG